MSWTVILGNNTFRNCDAALIVNGEEVFRLRGRSNGQLVADFDVRDAAGTRIAKVAGNNAPYVAPGYAANHGPSFTEIVETSSARIVAKAEEVNTTTVRLMGEFHVNGYGVTIDGNGIRSPNASISDSTFDNFGTAIVLAPGGAALGVGRPASPKTTPNVRSVVASGGGPITPRTQTQKNRAKRDRQKRRG